MSRSPHVVPEAAHGARLVDHVRRHLAVVAAREVGPLIARGGVTIGDRPGRIAEPVRAGDVLGVDTDAITELRSRRLVTEPADLGLDVVHEDDHLIVVDKPSGVHVHPMGPHRDDTLVGGLLWYAGARPDVPWAAWRPHPAHRLDRATSGLMVLTKDRATQHSFQRLLDTRLVARTYHAGVHGEVVGPAGTVDLPLGRDPAADYRRAPLPVERGGRPAVTHWRVLRRGHGRTLVELTLETGRTHQIRVHLATLGHPIVGDRLYGAPPTAGTAPVELRAVRLAFPHPRTGEPIDVSRPAPHGADARQAGAR